MISALFACTLALQQGSPTTPVASSHGKPPSRSVGKLSPVKRASTQERKSERRPSAAADDPKGYGAPVRTGDIVVIQFRVKRVNGDVVADSKRRGLPYTMKIGAPGNDPLLDMVVTGMRVGGVRTSTVSAKDAYGSDGAPPAIAPKDVLEVTISLLRRGEK